MKQYRFLPAALLLIAALCLCGAETKTAPQTQNPGHPNLKSTAALELKAPPAVFAVEDHYQILILVKSTTLVRIKVGNKFYLDCVNGVRRTKRNVHRFRIPAAELNKAGSYEVFCRKVPKRLPYFHKTKPQKETSAVFQFKNLPGDKVRIFHISDVHSRPGEAIRAAGKAGEFDLLILNGDIVDTVIQTAGLEHPCLIAGKITSGSKPAIYARGNHELRGVFAEEQHYYTPHVNERSYYYIDLPPIRAVVLDGGEDKPDDHPAYGFTIDCKSFREEQVSFLRKQSQDPQWYKPGIRYRLVISHIPFPRYVINPSRKMKRSKFPVYKTWNDILKEKIKPQLLISGHVHRFRFENRPDFASPVLMGSTRKYKPNELTGSRITLSPKEILMEHIDPEGKTAQSFKIPVK